MERVGLRAFLQSAEWSAVSSFVQWKGAAWLRQLRSVSATDAAAVARIQGQLDVVDYLCGAVFERELKEWLEREAP